jgi:branched-chain amino acid transport system substrate-binding protein
MVSRAGKLTALALGLSGLTSCIESYSDGAKDDDVVVGALLPFAGDQAGTGPNLERALVFLAETVNQAGGINGHHLRFEVRDGHTDARRAAKAAHELVESGAVAVVGPVKADTAATVIPILDKAGVLAITGGWAADGSGALLRTAPTSQALASVLVERARSDGVKRLAVVHVSDAYGKSFASAVLAELTHDTEMKARALPVEEDQTSFEDVATDLQTFSADAVVVVTYLRQAADLALELPRVRLYLTSTLKNEQLLRNAPLSVFEGAVGVSPAVSTDFTVFARSYRDRWHEDPLEEAAFFYDAGALVALALESAETDGQKLSSANLRPKLIELSRAPRGQAASWFQLGSALESVHAKRALNYRGVSGAVDLTDQGQVGRGLVQLWQIERGKIVPIATVAASL